MKTVTLHSAINFPYERKKRIIVWHLYILLRKSKLIFSVFVQTFSSHEFIFVLSCCPFPSSQFVLNRVRILHTKKNQNFQWVLCQTLHIYFKFCVLTSEGANSPKIFLCFDLYVLTILFNNAFPDSDPKFKKMELLRCLLKLKCYWCFSGGQSNHKDQFIKGGKGKFISKTFFRFYWLLFC